MSTGTFSQRLVTMFPIATMPRTRSIPFFPAPGGAKPLLGQSAFWRINGHLAKIVVWTHEEWIALEHHPSDAQFYPCGVWCALRLDDSPVF
jgi:hypothetical protein